MDKKKKIIFIVIIILISIILGILIIYCNIQNTKLKELDKIQKESLLDMNDKIEYGQEVTYEDILTKIVNTEKLPKNTKIEILINDKPLSSDEKYSFENIGKYKISAKLSYMYNENFISREIKNENSMEIEIKDDIKPVINGITDKIITVGEDIDLLKGISANDNIDGELQVKIEGKVDNKKVGKYEIKVIAEDKSGNISEGKYTVSVKEKEKKEEKKEKEEKNISKNEQDSKKETTTAKAKSKNKTATSKENKSSKKTTAKTTSKSTTKKSTSTSSKPSNYNPKTTKTSDLLSEAKKARKANASQISTIFNLTNKYRKEKGVVALKLDETLTQLACVRAIEMAYSGKVEHYRPNGRLFTSVLEDVGLYPLSTGENIAYMQSNGTKAAKWWRNSPGHYKNMTNEKFYKIGIGAFKYKGTYYWVQIFASEY